MMLKKAKMEDCYVLWKIRNNPRVKKNFFNTDTVSLKEHKKWFIDKVSDNDTEIYIAEHNGVKIGSARFEKHKRTDSNESLISVSIDPDFFGKGYGSEIIKSSTERFFLEHGKTKISAKIKNENIASQKAFEKAGYRKVSKKKNEVTYEK